MLHNLKNRLLSSRLNLAENIETPQKIGHVVSSLKYICMQFDYEINKKFYFLIKKKNKI